MSASTVEKKNSSTTSCTGHGWRFFPWLTLLGSAAAAGIFMVPRFADALAYSTQAPHSWWRAITCHWVHWNGEHLGWSVLAFLLMGVMCEQQNRRLFAACVAFSSLIVPLALRGMAVNLPSYAGLSGIDFALYTLFCTTLLRQTARRRDWLPCALAGVLLAAAFAKIAYELATGGVLFVTDTSALAPVPQAHLLAAIIGVALGIAPPLVWRGRGTASIGMFVRSAGSQHVGRFVDAARTSRSVRSNSGSRF